MQNMPVLIFVKGLRTKKCKLNSERDIMVIFLTLYHTKGFVGNMKYKSTRYKRQQGSLIMTDKSEVFISSGKKNKLVELLNLKSN